MINRTVRQLPGRVRLSSAFLITIVCLCLLMVIFAIKTFRALIPFAQTLPGEHTLAVKPRYLDRHGQRLNVTYQNPWNLHNILPVHEIPELLQQAFILSEDKRFYQHSGPDWSARLNAARQNVMKGKVVRGASTISEQVVRMLHPRPRSLWSRWLEGFEATQLENRFGKLAILEFYLNQVPYHGNRRGVKEAADYYFNREPDTLNLKEMLALAVLVRSPRWFDPEKYAARLNRAVINLAERVHHAGFISTNTLAQIQQQPLSIERPEFEFNAEHFIRYVDSASQFAASNTVTTGISSHINTTLDIHLQQPIQDLLNNRLDYLHSANVNNGAVLVVDHQRNDILAWVVGYAGQKGKRFNQLDPVIIPRQSGSTLKPFLYAQALTQGWTAATLIDDTRLEQSVGAGMHTYHNYSREHYGSISLRESLGNSLNIPAVKAIQFVGAPNFLDFIYRFGVHSLSEHPNVYGDGIALGNGEVTLLELVAAYAGLARAGEYKPLSVIEGAHVNKNSQRAVSEDVASLIGDILSDPAAREKEFGWDSILNFPHQTAVKTGTSNDYRDAWALGYNDRYTVGVWLGNLDYSAMNRITGSTGPAVILRSVFNLLNTDRVQQPLYFSERLEKHAVCLSTGLLASSDCESKDEWFIPGVYPDTLKTPEKTVRIRKPTPGLRMAMDPRLPDSSEYFEFALSTVQPVKRVDWYVNNKKIHSSHAPNYLWPLRRGEFAVKARIWFEQQALPVDTEPVDYVVN